MSTLISEKPEKSGKSEKQNKSSRGLRQSNNKGFFLHVRSWFMANEKNLVLFVSLLLISAFSFEVGVLKSQDAVGTTLIIEKPVEAYVAEADRLDPLGEGTVGIVAGAETTTPNTGTSSGLSVGIEETQSIDGCMFVGSKNSTKYHTPSCRWAKQIKPENRVCFSSVEDAVAQGYVEGCVE